MRRNAICGTSQRHCASLCAYGRLGLAGKKVKLLIISSLILLLSTLEVHGRGNCNYYLDSNKINTIRRIILDDLIYCDSIYANQKNIDYYNLDDIRITQSECKNGNGFVLYNIEINLKHFIYYAEEVKYKNYILFQYKSIPQKFSVQSTGFLKISGFYFTDIYQLYNSFWNKNLELFESDVDELEIFTEEELTSIVNYIKCNFNCSTDKSYPIKSVYFQSYFNGKDNHLANSKNLFYQSIFTRSPR